MKVALIGDSLTEGRPGVSFYNILEEKFPNYTFVNLGKPGETVKSLHKRLSKTKLAKDYDLSFLWIGVNDVYSKLLSVQAQPVAKDHVEFKEYYQSVFNIVLESSKKIVVVTPALVGEDINNVSNKEIKELSTIIESVATHHENVHFLNMQTFFEKRLADVNSSDYISTNPMRVMMDVFFYKKATKIDELSKKRGLNLTLDGIHLNSHGAQMVADVYASIINHIKNSGKETA
ncbi:SGNH/GDSL hydrolase family protein [Psychrobacillus sp. NPDC058041]|uniref:SGNH/GDSL hydrolase family protein n=1 Tax=Psychrobacillus sp. NPDC058041 TaxID=3346310 RepID=UPI0036DA9571